MSERIEVKMRYSIIFLHILGCLMFVALGYFMIANPWDIRGFRNPANKFIAVICILYFGYILLMNLLLILKFSRYLAIADKDYFYVTDTFANWGEIDWEDIICFEKTSFGGLAYISLLLEDIDKYVERLSFFQRILYSINKKYNYKIGIRVQFIKENPKKLCEDLNNFRVKVIESRQRRQL